MTLEEAYNELKAISTKEGLSKWAVSNENLLTRSLDNLPFINIYKDKEAGLKMNDTLYSACCGAEIKNTDYDLCPECSEHTGFIRWNEEGTEYEEVTI